MSEIQLQNAKKKNGEYWHIGAYIKGLGAKQKSTAYSREKFKNKNKIQSLMQKQEREREALYSILGIEKAKEWLNSFQSHFDSFFNQNLLTDFQLLEQDIFNGFKKYTLDVVAKYKGESDESKLIVGEYIFTHQNKDWFFDDRNKYGVNRKLKQVNNYRLILNKNYNYNIDTVLVVVFFRDNGFEIIERNTFQLRNMFSSSAIQAA